jgi:signal transduction histidine kinase
VKIILAAILVCFFIHPDLKALPDLPDSLIIVNARLPDNKEKADNYVKLAVHYLNLDQDSTLHYCGKAIELGVKIGYPVAEAEGYHLKSLVLNKKDMFRESLPLVEKYLALVIPLNDSMRIAKGFYNQGNIFKGFMDYDQAIVSFRKSLGIYYTLNDPKGIIGNNNSLGALYLRKSVYDSSAYYFLAAVEMCEKAGREDLLRIVFDNLSEVYIEMEQYDLARKYAEKGIALSRKFGDQNDEAEGLTTMGRIASAEGKYDEALNYYMNARRIFTEREDVVSLADINNNIGVLLHDRERYEESLQAYDEALNGYQSLDYTRGIIVVLGNKAVNMYSMGKYHEAATLHQEVLRLCEEYDAPDYKLDALDNLAWTYSKTGDFQKAFEYHALYADFKDSLFDIEQTRVISDLTLKYEKQKDQAQILQLENLNLEKDLDLRKRTSQRNAYFYSGLGILALALFLVLYFRQRAAKDKIIAEQRIRQLQEEQKLMAAKLLVEGQEQERKRIARELHDGLGVLLSATRMQFTSIRDTSPENRPLIDRATQLLEQAAGDVRKISHNMMPGLLTKLGLYEAVADLVDNLNNSGNIIAQCDIADDLVRLPENQEIMIYRIIQEMVNNTLKYANAKNIIIRIQSVNNRLMLEYSDDGKGFDLVKLEDSKSIGLKSIQSRVNFLNGQVSVSSQPGEGVHYLIKMPV